MCRSTSVLGLKVESIDPEAPKLRFDMRPELVGNPRRQILHGGVISAVLDVAGGFAIMLAVSGAGSRIRTSSHFPDIGTIDLRVDYLRPGRGKYFVATGEHGAHRQPHRGGAYGAAERCGRAHRHRRRGVYGGGDTLNAPQYLPGLRGRSARRAGRAVNTHEFLPEICPLPHPSPASGGGSTPPE